MATSSAGRKILINGGTIHPFKINENRNSSLKKSRHIDDISLKSVSTISGSVQLARAEKTIKQDQASENAASKKPVPFVMITELSEDESKSRLATGTPEPGLRAANKLLNGLRTGNGAAAKWATAGKKVRRAVAVTHAFHRPETRQEKVRKQLYGSKSVLPVLPISVAVMLLVANILVPGLGTILAGFTFCCCATTYDKPDRKGIAEKVPGLICRNMLVGLAQFFTIFFVLVGWFWSIAWGVTMVQLAVERDKEKREGSDWFPDAIN